MNPDITIDEATTQRFLEQAKSELGPYYRQQFQQTESDLKLGFQRLKEDQAKRELALSKQYGTELERTQESYAQRGLDFSTQRERAEKQLAEGYSTEIEKGISEAARSAEDLGTKGERVLGSAAYPSVDTSIRTGTTPGLGQPGIYGFNFGTGSRSLFNPIGGTLGTLERSRLFEEEKEKERFIRNETLRLSSTIQ